jgi:hypothetical protein
MFNQILLPSSVLSAPRSTLYVIRYTLHAPLFTQNKPNLLDTEMNVTVSITKEYENLRLYSRGENKPNL